MSDITVTITTGPDIEVEVTDAQPIEVTIFGANDAGITEVAAGAGMDFETITGTGSVDMGTPSTISISTINETTATSHTHELDTSGITANAAGSSGQIQFNNDGDFGADSNLYWDNTNKRLGIGTDSPTGKLEVYDGNLVLNSGYVDRQWELIPRNYNYYNNHGYDLEIVYGGTDYGGSVVIPDNSVVIGKTSGGATLDVSGSSFPVARIERTSSTGAGVSGALSLSRIAPLGNNGFGVGQYFQLTNSAGTDNCFAGYFGARWNNAIEGSEVGELIFTPAYHNNDPYADDPIMTIRATAIGEGNVYIPNDNNKILFGSGNDASIYYDGTDLIFNSQEVGLGNFIFQSGDVNIAGGNIQMDNNAVVYFGDSGRAAIQGVSGAFGRLNFNTNAYERMRIDSSGNVGIGITSPTTRLHVAGTTAQDYIQSDVGFNINQVEAEDELTTSLIEADGNIDEGTHYYGYCYITDLGETDMKRGPASLVTVDATHRQVKVTIPVSSDYRVTGKKLYRSRAGQSYGLFYHLATINDNTTVEYIDNIADADLGSSNEYRKPNTTNNQIRVNGKIAMNLGVFNTIFGQNAGKYVLSNGGHSNAFFGEGAGQNVTTGYSNTCLGDGAGLLVSTATNNTIVGATAGYNWTGGSNTMIGAYSGYGGGRNSGGGHNIFLGYGTAYNHAVGDHYKNVLIGNNSGWSLDGDFNVFVGYKAGYYETGSSKLYIDCTDTSNPLIYGDFDNRYIRFGEDDTKLFFGTASDASIYYDGTNLVIDPAEVGSGLLDLQRPLKIADNTLLTTPQAGTFEFDNDRMYLTNVNTQRAIDRTSDVVTSTTTVTNTTTETTVFTGAIPANAGKAGNVYDVKISGDISTGSSSDTATVRFKVGGNTIATITSPGKNLSSACWKIEAKGTLRTVGTSGSFAYLICMCIEDESSNTCGVLTGVDTTTAENITVTVEWNTAKAGNILNTYQGWVTYKN